MTDLNNDGQFGLYNITGPRHSRGGVPMFLPEQSFVYSDTAKMKMNRQELAEFGIESRKKMTPAKVSKKFQLNEYIGALKDRDADHISVTSAELMIDKNSNSLSKLAFGQEAKKNFAEGVPLAAYPYLSNQGIDPFQFSQQVEQSQQAAQNEQLMALQNMMAQAGQAAYGTELPKAQMAGEPSIGQLARRLPAPAGAYVQNDPDGDGIPTGIDLQLYIFNVTPPAPAVAPSSAQQPRAVPQRRGFSTSGLTGDRSLGAGAKAYSNLERLFTSGDAMWNETVDKTYNAFVENAKAKGITNIPSKEDMVKKFLTYQKNNYMVQDLAPEQMRMSAQLDQGDPNQNTQKLFNELQRSYPDQYKGYKINPAEPELNQLFFQSLVATDRQSDNPYLGYSATGPEESGNWQEGKTISSADGFYGNNPLNQLAQVKEPGEPEETTPEEEIDIEPGETPVPAPLPDPEFWTQDLLKMGALAMRDRDLLLPYQPSVEIPQAGYVLEEPTRQLADINEQLNIAGQALGAFAGPQSLSARLSSAQGEAFKQSANALAQVQARNIGTVTRGKMVDSQLEAAAKREQRDRTVKYVEDTNLAVQNYMDERNLDREQFADLAANALTNRANTYNLNTLYPYYNIDPTTGFIDFAGNTPSLALTQPTTGSDFGLYTNRANAYRKLKDEGFDEEEIKIIMQGKGTPTTTPMDQTNEVYDPRLILQGGYAAAPTAKKGKEVKKYAVPFYVGKAGS